MHHYAYKAMDATGKLARGRLAASSAIELEHSLKRLGLDLISFRPARNQRAFLGGPNLHDQALFCFQMEQLLHAGVPLLQALDELHGTMDNPVLRLALAHLKLAIEGGQSLSQALSQHEHCFPRLIVNLIHIGEVTGRPPEIFRHLAATLSWHEEIAKKTQRALVYPLFVFVVVFASAAFLLVYLVPQMAVFFKTVGQSLPLHTQLMLAASDHLGHYGWHWLCAFASVIAAATWAIAVFPTAHRVWDGAKLRLPVIGPLLHKSIMARFTRYLALMYQTGLPLIDALEHCRGAAGNLVVASHIEMAIDDIRSGQAMSDSLQQRGIFPPLVIRMLHIGETTGNLDTALNRVSEYYDRDIQHSIETLLKLLEPTLTLLLGGLMALVMLSVLGPIYDAISEIRL
jgi:type IV pilus assembly protein PilC